MALCLVLAVRVEGKLPAEEITDALKQGEWAKADALLVPYMTDHPDQKWTYTSRSWALRNLKEYGKAVTIAESGLKQWPADPDLKKAAATALGDLAETQLLAESIDTLKRALAYSRTDYLLYRLAKKHREAKEFEQAIRLLETGIVEFPAYPHFKEILPFTRYLFFKQQKDPGKIRDFVDRAAEWIDPAIPVYAQEHYMMIINGGLRELGDRKKFEEIYQRLFSKIRDDAHLYDSYGFSLYATFRVHGRTNDALREDAIRSRKRAHEIFWKKNSLPHPVTSLGHPLRGRHAVWSGFGGKAMTHNGLSNYCYDFAAVDEKGSIMRVSSGKRIDDYYMFNQPVYAVADGTVSGIVDGFSDNAPGDYGKEANTITVRHKDFSSFYAHLKNHGTLVRADQAVKSGDLLGYVGNSGMSSQPHLHFCIYGTYPEWVTIPFRFRNARVVGHGPARATDEPYKEGETVIFEGTNRSD